MAAARRIQDREALEELVDSGDPALVLFYADWCPWCRRFLPTFRFLADDYADVATFASVDVDVAPDLEQEWGIGKIPCVLLIRDGAEQQRWVNAQNTRDYQPTLDQLRAEVGA